MNPRQLPLLILAIFEIGIVGVCLFAWQLSGRIDALYFIVGQGLLYLIWWWLKRRRIDSSMLTKRSGSGPS